MLADDRARDAPLTYLSTSGDSTWPATSRGKITVKGGRNQLREISVPHRFLFRLDVMVCRIELGRFPSSRAIQELVQGMEAGEEVALSSEKHRLVGITQLSCLASP